MDYDPETGEFPDRPEQEEVDDNVLAGKLASPYCLTLPLVCPGQPEDLLLMSR